MKVTLKSIIFGLLVSVFISCSIDSHLSDNQLVSFSISFNPPASNLNARIQENEFGMVTHMVITIKHMDGRDTEYSLTKVEVFEVDGGFQSEDIHLPLGSYKITTLYLVDSEDNILYATPHKDSSLAQEVNISLPITDISISESTEAIKTEVLSTEGFTPDDFGMDSFEGKFKGIDLDDVTECQGGAYYGDVIFNTQEEVDAFGSKCYTKIEGYLSIGSLHPENFFSITDLGPLESLQEVTGILQIRNNKALTSLDGLNNLSSDFRIITIIGNENLESLSELRNLSVKFLRIEENNSLSNLDGLQGLRTLDPTISIISNQNLLSLKGLENLKSIGGLSINNNEKFHSFEGLENLEELGSLFIRENSSLTSLSDFGNSISSISNVTITDNPALVDLKGLLSEDGYIQSSLTIDNNASLESLEGLKFYHNMFFTVELINNPRLTDISAMSNIYRIGRNLIIKNNEKLSNLTGLENLNSVGYRSHADIDYFLSIISNKSLNNFCPLSNLFQNGQIHKKEIKFNAYNPTALQMKENECTR